MKQEHEVVEPETDDDKKRRDEERDETAQSISFDELFGEDPNSFHHRSKQWQPPASRISA